MPREETMKQEFVEYITSTIEEEDFEVENATAEFKRLIKEELNKIINPIITSIPLNDYAETIEMNYMNKSLIAHEREFITEAVKLGLSENPKVRTYMERHLKAMNKSESIEQAFDMERTKASKVAAGIALKASNMMFKMEKSKETTETD